MTAEAEAVAALYTACCIEANDAEQFKGPAHIREARSQLQIAGMLRQLSQQGGDDDVLEAKIHAHPLAEWALGWVKDYVARKG